MGKAAELKGLPSMVEMEDGGVCALEALSQKEREEYQKRMKENMELQMGCYFARHPEEWKRFMEG